MKIFRLFILFFIAPLSIIAQINGSVKGYLSDSASKQPIENATISLLFLKDSSLVSYTLSDKNGNFELKKINEGQYVMIISYTSYSLWKMDFKISANALNVQLGNIILHPEYKTLTGVVVRDVSPVRIHGDTISFRTSAFNSRPDAYVEDILKKLPGIQVQKNGTITAMGEKVQKVYVDGKEFFGNDPKIATRNLTADMVDQIQVFDDMSEQSKFTKIDDGSRNKSINIKLKKDKRKGDFGRINAGVGTDSRYEGNFSWNHFNDDQRLSIVGSGNNTNKISYAFSFNSGSEGSLTQFSNSGSGAAGLSTGAGNTTVGISSPISGGINFNNRISDKLDFRGSYFYSHNNYYLELNKYRYNSFPGDSASIVDSKSQSENNSNNHRINGRWEYAIDSSNSLLYAMNLSFQNAENLFDDSSITYSKGVYDYLAIQSATSRIDNRSGINYMGDLLYRRRFTKAGRTFTLGWRSGLNTSRNKSMNHSPVEIYDRYGNIQSYKDVNQNGLQNGDGSNSAISATYTEPIGANKLIELNYAISGSKNTSDKKTYDFNNGSGKYDLINHQLSNYFEYKNRSSRMGFNFRHILKKYSYQLGLAVQFADLDNESKTSGTMSDTTISQHYINFFPTANFSYSFTKSKSIRIFYRGRTNAPSIMQLQDVEDLSNPLQIKTGNSSLKQEFSHSINVNYNSYESSTERLLSCNINFSFTQNKIVNSISNNGNSTVIIRPENLNGFINGSSMVSVSFPIKQLKGANININNLAYLSRDPGLVFGTNYFTTLLQINQLVGIGYSEEKFDGSLNAGIVYNQLQYDLQPDNSNKYFSQSYSADFSYRFLKNMYILSDLDFYTNSGRADGYNQSSLLWNVSMAKKFLTNNAGEIKFTVYDILKQNTGINRAIGENYYEDIRGIVVPRFFIVSLLYRFNKMGGKKAEAEKPTPMINFR